MPWAERLQGALSVTVLMTDDGRGAELPGERRYPVLSGKVQSLAGYLGAYRLRWMQRNPIDLEACTRCGACIAAYSRSASAARFRDSAPPVCTGSVGTAR